MNVSFDGVFQSPAGMAIDRRISRWKSPFNVINLRPMTVFITARERLWFQWLFIFFIIGTDEYMQQMISSLLSFYPNDIQCPPLNRITLGQHKSDNNNRMIQLTDVICVLLGYKRASNFWLQWAADSIIRDPVKRWELRVFIFLMLFCYWLKIYFKSKWYIFSV